MFYEVVFHIRNFILVINRQQNNIQAILTNLYIERKNPRTSTFTFSFRRYGHSDFTNATTKIITHQWVLLDIFLPYREIRWQGMLLLSQFLKLTFKLLTDFDFYFHTIVVPLVLSRNHQHSVVPFLPTWLTLIH